MLEVLRTRAYRQLFSAQVIALVGTGLLTIALGLLAFDLAGEDAGTVLGIALTIKMVAYVGVSPLMSALAGRLPRKAVLIGSDLIRASVALSLPLITETWQIYPLIFVLQSASAAFTPAFQALIPEVLPDERQYTRALSLSRLAYDLEALLSPVLAAALLTAVTYNSLFVGTTIGFLCSAVLVLSTRLPAQSRTAPSPFVERLTRGISVFGRTPELRGLSALNMTVACSTAMVIVNTVPLVQGVLGRPESDVALLLAAYGAGSMLVALGTPRLLNSLTDRTMMLTGGALVPAGLVAGAVIIGAASGSAGWVALLAVWAILGSAGSLILTPSARLLNRAADDTNRTAVFAAQFSLSHACFMLTYPVAGIVGKCLGLEPVSLILAVLGGGTATLAHRRWPTAAPSNTPHVRRPSDKPH